MGTKGAHIFIHCWIKTKVGDKMHSWGDSKAEYHLIIVIVIMNLLISSLLCTPSTHSLWHFYQFLAGRLTPQWCLVSICSTLSPEAGSDSESSDSEDELESPGHKVPNVGFEGSSPQGSPVKQASASSTASDSKMEVDPSDGVLLKSLCYHHTLPNDPNHST